MTFDSYTDNIHHRSYNTYTYHYIDDEWNLKSTVLKTSLMEQTHTAQNICDDFQRVLKEFKLQNKKIVLVTDSAPNMVMACRLSGHHRYPCIAHKGNLLVQKDMLGNPSVKEIPALIGKIREGQKKLMYRFDELRRIREIDTQNQMALLLNEICELDEILDAENQFTIEPEDDTALSNLIHGHNQNEFSGLRTVNNIRWGCTFKLATSYKNNSSELFEN